MHSVGLIDRSLFLGPASDAGRQYVAFRYTERLTAAGAVASIGTVSDSCDNTFAESTISLYKNERVKHDGSIRTTDNLGLASLSWGNWLSTSSPHSSNGYMTPIEFEQEHYRHINAQQLPLPRELALH